MTNFVVDRESVSWWLQKPVWLTARLSVDYEMVKRTVRGETIGSLPSLYPFDFFRQACIDGAKRWLRDMVMQNSEYELIGNETDIKVWGPVRPRTHRIEQPLIARLGRADAWSQEDFPFPQGKADIVFGANFKAKYAKAVEVGKRLPQLPQEEE